MRRRTYISIFFVLVIIASLIAVGYWFGKDAFSSKKTGWINNGSEYNIDLKYIPDGSGKEVEKIVYEYYLPNDSSTGKVLAQLKSIPESDNIQISFVYSKEELADGLNGEAYKDLILEPKEKCYVYLIINVIDPNKEAYYRHNVEWVLRTKVNVTFDLGCGPSIVKEVLLGASLPTNDIPEPPNNILGCEINGWYEDPKGLIPADLSQGFMSDATIYAICKYVKTDWISYNSPSKSYYIKKGSGVLPEELIIPDTYNNGVNGLANITYIYSSPELNDNNEGDGIDPNDTNGVFAEQKNITTVELPSTLTSIGDYAFNNCQSLNKVGFPEGLENIGKYAFRYCGLTSVYIPKNVTTIASNAFRYTDNLESITVSPNNATYDSRGNCNCIIKTSTNALVIGSKNGFIPSGVTLIDEWAFNNVGVSTITFPNTVKRINIGAFYGCEKLTEVSIPSTIEYLGERAFCNCSGLKSAVVGSKTIKQHIFAGAQSLTGITLLEGVESVGNGILESCPVTSITIPASTTSIAGSLKVTGFANFKSLKVAKGNTVYTSRDPSGKECNVILKIATGELIMGCHISTIPNGTKIIRQSAFGGNYELTAITIPRSVTTIEKQAFRYTTSMTSIIVQSGNPVYTSRDSSGNECNVIIEIASATLLAGCRNSTIPNGVKHIEEYAFYCQRGFPSKALSLPSTLETIGSHAFWDAGIKNIVIPANVTKIGCHSFSYNSKGSNTFESITFEDASTWYVTTSSSYTGGAMLTEDALNNGAKNATLFGDTYNSYYWYKK